jgi:outer membrane lipoprotein-sorting protein
MTKPSKNHDSEFDRRLADWLREAADGQLSGIASHVANVRLTLLERLEAGRPTPVHPTRPTGASQGLARLVARHRIVLGSIGASLALAVTVVLVALNSNARLSAMERVAKELCGVTSYSYRLRWRSTYAEEGGKLTTSKGDGMTYWLAPDAFRDEMTIVKVVENDSQGQRNEEELEHFAQIFPAGKPGILIDHHRKTFQRILYEPIGSKTYPWDLLRMIREGSYDLVRDLGMKRIGATSARGYVLRLKNSHDKFTVRDPVELWVDARTNLPLEFSYGGTNAGSTYVDRATDFRWNIELNPKMFEPAPPEGYADITPPSDRHDLVQIAAALRLYSQLSGGHYPRTKSFNASEVRDEMKKMAGFVGATKPEWASDKTHHEIEQAAVGLNWIARIVRIPYLSGYRGLDVGPADKDKVLLWWMASNNRYRVFYGDLRTEVLTEAEAAKLGVTEAAPDSGNDDQKPKEQR